MLIAFPVPARVVIMTNARPVDKPVSRSLIMATEATAPACANNVRRSSFEVVSDKLPTSSLASISCLLRDRLFADRNTSRQTLLDDGEGKVKRAAFAHLLVSLGRHQLPLT